MPVVQCTKDEAGTQYPSGDSPKKTGEALTQERVSLKPPAACTSETAPAHSGLGLSWTTALCNVNDTTPDAQASHTLHRVGPASYWVAENVSHVDAAAPRGRFTAISRNAPRGDPAKGISAQLRQGSAGTRQSTAVPRACKETVLCCAVPAMMCRVRSK